MDSELALSSIFAWEYIGVHSSSSIQYQFGIPPRQYRRLLCDTQGRLRLRLRFRLRIVLHIRSIYRECPCCRTRSHIVLQTAIVVPFPALPLLMMISTQRLDQLTWRV